MEINELDLLDQEFACPLCNQPTRHLKQYRYIRWFVFIFVGSLWQATVIRACPSCMRWEIGKYALFNMLPANFLWLVLLLPWAMVLCLMSLVDGHSRAVLQGLTPAMILAKENRAQELNGHRVWAVLSLLLFWIPLFGLILSTVGWFRNVHEKNWTKPASLVGLSLSGMAHLILAGIVVYETVRQL